MNDLSDVILKSTQEAGKTYSFDEIHDDTVPADLWFQQSDEGLVLFVVFYCQACRWSRCLGCNLPSKMSQNHVSYKALMAQIDRVFSHPEVLGQCKDIRKVIVSNNGSVLDHKTFSSTALMYLMAKLNLHLPNLVLLSLETRPEYVDVGELEFLSRAIAEGDTPTNLEIAIGFEAFDERIRNEIFDKGLSSETFESLASKIADYKYHLKCYFMQKPVPEMSDSQAIDDIRHAIDYLSEIAARFNIHVNMHLNPTFVARGTMLEQAFLNGEYSPPLLQDVARAAQHGQGKRISIFIGLSDEGLAVQGGSFIRDDSEPILRQLQKFNITQDYDILNRISEQPVVRPGLR